MEPWGSLFTSLAAQMCQKPDPGGGGGGGAGVPELMTTVRDALASFGLSVFPASC